jgi:hypothetical protein
LYQCGCIIWKRRSSRREQKLIREEMTMVEPKQQPIRPRAYAGPLHRQMPYSALVEPIINACALDTFSSSSTLHILDAMSGPGNLGLAMHAQIAIQSRRNALFHYNDVCAEPLAHIDGVPKLICDVRDVGTRYPNTFNIVAVRYGITNLPQAEQAAALASIYESLADAGRIVVADFTAISDGARKGIAAVHAARQELAGRDAEKEGRCHIPLVTEWPRLLTAAGFTNAIIGYRNDSLVSTGNWRGQFGNITADEVAIPALNGIISKTAQGNRAFARECSVNISYKTGIKPDAAVQAPDNIDGLTLNFPVMVVAGDKLSVPV